MLTNTTNARDGLGLATEVRLLAHDAFNAVRRPAGSELRDVVRRIALLQRELEESGRSSTELSRWLTNLKRQVRAALDAAIAAEPQEPGDWVSPSAPLRRRMQTAGSRG